MRLLVVEDEPKMAALLSRGLREEGFLSDIAPTGAEALWLVAEQRYDAVLLAVMLPDMSAVERCGPLRARQLWSPVIMLTALGAVRDKVPGLDAGADDYVVKPFDF